MANYATSSPKMLLRNIYRFVVTMEDEETGKVLTFAVKAATAAIATARTTQYIDEHKLHDGGTYFLIPRISKEQANYNID